MSEFNSLLLLTSVVLFSLLAVFLFDKISPIKLFEHGRNNQIDGMRGLLAIFVLIHHAIIWYGYLLSGIWKAPEVNFATNLGQVGVTFFFMITGYLFYSKIRSSDQDWTRLYISRFLRLTPMFVVSFFLVLLVVGFKSGWKISVPPASLIESIMRWVPFTALGTPNINGVINSFTINAGVTWTLVYEWFFYLSLPVMALFFRKRVSILLVTISILTLVIFFAYNQLDKTNIISFAFGLFASYLTKSDFIQKFAKCKASSIVIVVIMAFETTYFSTTYNPLPIILCGICFILITSGCDLFGIFKSNIARKLGEATYSIYLLHGIFLYCSMTWLIPGSFSLTFYVFFVSGTAFLTVLTSCLTFKYIELPFINATKNVTEIVKDKITIAKRKFWPMT